MNEHEQTEIEVIKNDIGWIKRAIFGIYGLIGAVLVAYLAELSSHTNKTATLILHWLGGLL